MRESAERQFGNANLVVLSDRFYGIERYEATAFDLMLEGASAGATLGLFAGAVANTAGFWEEDTSWYIMGAAAAVGALLGYTNADDPGKRARYRWRLGVDAQDR
jgi:hypothetical protein